ncbi:PEX28-32 family peroxisomal membrane protein [Kluyveromyces lactis]|uniref:KLLA0C18238p n=1 Tax=Kluyveromyces lactis (strain ATCC 8585 / CBS 2359 / DSM 70799 / NBRC 1267 / NRRL Y-1140 / WM37) TaxID=284590 RepID=Q6CSS7_KLULA|nr:uncharacterized protein KLLA0_C18238g [Kluyveromyces lactis]CAH01863.1 KLLA0C18238p [Kluyveromyces lactis]|eukprot:XP_453012.1 uncharacterized protein KLLA0_C18238g [Kluyveromyces lactis]
MSDINETRAQFLDTDKDESKLSEKASHTLRSALKKQEKQKLGGRETNFENSNGVESSPLLNSTPPTVSKALVKLYPYLVVCNEFLGLLTWTSDDIWKSVLMVICYIAVILYFQVVVRYFGHFLFVGLLWGYSALDTFVETTIKEKPTLDDIVHIISCVYTKADLLLSPLSVWTGNDIKRILLTMAFLSPVYVIVSIFIFSSQKLVLIAGVYVLTYHSSWSVVTRRLLWKLKVVRLLVFYITGLDLSGVNKHQGGIFAAVHKKVKNLSSSSIGTDADDGKPIRFTYVLYENQRRWLGIGWTANMLTYERSSWTDEFLNEAPSPEQFKLPEEASGMAWRWVDKTWRLDMTNDGAIQLSSTRPKTTASPGADDGFIYYDNTWKKPSTEDSFSKYTRRRRWIRTAELIKIGAVPSMVNLSDSHSSDENTTEKRKSVRIEEPGSQSNQRKVSFSDTSDVRIIPDDSYEKDTEGDSDASSEEQGDQNKTTDDNSEVIEESPNENFQRSTDTSGDLKSRVTESNLASSDDTPR